MKRLLFFAAAYMTILGAAWAQNGVSVRVISPPCGTFYVDGQFYTEAATFFWPVNTSHTLTPGITYFVSSIEKCVVGNSWTVANGSGGAAQALPGTTQSIYVTGPATYTLPSSYLYLVGLMLNNGTGVPAFNCNGGGYATVNGACYAQDASIWHPRHGHDRIDQPAPGFCLHRVVERELQQHVNVAFLHAE